MDIVVLSNISPAQAPPRLRNLAALPDFPFALIANTGPKGPAVKALAARGGKPVFFVDDIPSIWPRPRKTRLMFSAFI